MEGRQLVEIKYKSRVNKIIMTCTQLSAVTTVLTQVTNKLVSTSKLTCLQDKLEKNYQCKKILPAYICIIKHSNVVII